MIFLNRNVCIKLQRILKIVIESIIVHTEDSNSHLGASGNINFVMLASL